jgi:uncharacterized membrane protein
MAFCPNCGAEASGPFCPNCGTNIAAASGTGAGASGGYSPPPPPIANAPGLTDNVAGALCYLFTIITGIVFLVLAPYNQNRTVRFHAFQAIFFGIGVFVFYILWGFISVISHGLLFLFTPLFGLLFFCLWLYLMWTAYNNKRIKLPVIGDLAEKQA